VASHASSAPPPPPLDLLGLTSAELIQAAGMRLAQGAGVAPRLYAQAMRSGVFAPEGHGLASASVAGWREHFQVGLLTVVRVVTDAPDDIGAGAAMDAGAAGPGGTAKAVLRTQDGFEIECVRIPMRRGPDGQQSSWTLCISSQVGCRMGCTFCETGRMGLLRQLSAAEIVSQVVTVRAVLGWEVRNLVFMGMGEALDNADQVLQALQVLSDRRGLAFSQERLTVCTSGHAEGIQRLAALGWKRLNLSLSLNAGNDRARSQLMPVNRRTSLSELQRLLAAYPQRRNFILGINYCLLPGINDDPAQAREVAEFCRPLGRVLVNLIPYNPGSAPITRAPSEAEVEAFIQALREAGLPVRRRVTKGRTIMAACGQLGDVGLRARRRRPQPTSAPCAADQAS
jgi:23S rRNA (adenine2503-C2)-methyltransferase